MSDKKNKKAQKNHAKLIAIGFLTGLICSIALWGLSHLNFIKNFELISLDFRFKNRKEIQQTPNLGYVNLDNASCDLVGEWPWKRKYHVALTETLAFYGAKAAGYDVFFAEPSPVYDLSKNVNLDNIKTDNIDELIKDIYHFYDDDFRNALEKSEIIYLGEYLVGPEQINIIDDEKEIRNYIEKESKNYSQIKKDSIEAAQDDTFHIKDHQELDKHLNKSVDITAPIKHLSEVSKGVGFEQIIPDDIRGTVYEYPMFLEFNNKVYPALGLLIVADKLGIDLNQIKTVANEYIEFETTKEYENIKPGKFRVPVNQKLRLLMNWSGPYFDTFFHINFIQLSYYYAWNRSKEEIKKFSPKVVDYQKTYEHIFSFIRKNNWTPKKEASSIARDLTIARISELLLKQNNNKNEIIKNLKTQTQLKEDEISKVVDGLLLAQHVLANATAEEINEISSQLSNTDYLNFRSELLALDQFPGIDLKHAQEITRNVLAFRSKNNIQAVSPLYFPPCLETLANGKLISLSPTMLHDKIFMIGLEGEGTIDLNPQPHQEACAMVALHANAINTFLTQQFLTFPNKNLALIIALVLSISLGIITQIFPNRVSFPIFLISLSGFFYFCHQQFSENGKTIEMVFPSISIISSYFITVGMQLYVAFLEKQKVKGMFGKMVSPDVLKVMSDDPDMFSLTGKRMPCTSYFSSMENFSEISRGVTPQELTSLLSDYLTPASEIITSYNGYIDKYEGHIIMADFGVPLVSDDHKMQCLYSSIETQLDIDAFKTHAYTRYGKKVNTSMGVNTGFVSAGNMGSDRKMQYTIMGDTVNTAARFRPANWIYDYLGSIIIGESTYPLVKDIVQVRLLDKLLLKGKLKPVNIYQIMGWDPKTYLNTRGKVDVTETLRVCWAKNCPAGKIYGYAVHWKNQYERTQHPLCKKLADFFDAHINYSADLTLINMKDEVLRNFKSYKELEEKFTSITSKSLPELAVGPWQEILHNWSEEIESELTELENNYKNNREAERLHRELTEVHEKVEALNERLQWQETIHPLMDEAWDKVREYVSSDFHQDQNDYIEEYTQKYSEYEAKANELVDEVSPQMDQYHDMMAKVGSRTEKQTQGCKIYVQALELHWERKWDESIAKFKEVLEYLPEDKAALSFIKRLEGYKETPPGNDWQGEFKQTKK